MYICVVLIIYNIDCLLLRWCHGQVLLPVYPFNSHCLTRIQSLKCTLLMRSSLHICFIILIEVGFFIWCGQVTDAVHNILFSRYADRRLRLEFHRGLEC